MEDDATSADLKRPIWLVGHSYPARWVEHLKGPLDPRHPIRHNIWTSVLEVIQEVAYTKGGGRRVDAGKIFVCNAAAKQPHGVEPDWDYGGTSLPARLELFRGLLTIHKPPMVLTLGADVFGFASRACAAPPGPGHEQPKPANLNTVALGMAFRKAVAGFSPDRINVFPLLHRSIAGRGWRSGHEAFTGDAQGNYFQHVGEALGSLLISHAARLDVWQEHAS